jgi:hypothetical protein
LIQIETETQMMGIPKKEKGRGACLPHSARSRAVLAGRFLILGAQFFVDALFRGGKPQRGRRIVLKIDHIIIIGRIEGKVAGLSRQIMSGSIRSGPSNPGRAILSQDAVFFVDALCKCGKPRLGRWLY